MQKLDNTDINKLMKSEYDYFHIGSENRSIFGGEISVVPEFEYLASGCVLHNVKLKNDDTDLLTWLNDIETEFKKIKAPLCRFYLHPEINVKTKIFNEKGYEEVIEVGLIRHIENSLNDLKTVQGHLKLIDDNNGWHIKKNLYKISGKGPDGHNMKNGAFADFEKIKCDASYMTSFLYWKDEEPIGTVSLAIKNGFARLKNLLVHPKYRGKGIGEEIVISLMHEAKKSKATTFGVFAVKNMNAHKLYRSCGMKDILEQTEWSKELIC